MESNGQSKMTYWQQLKHPNWQKVRLLVMERARFCCENCGNTEATLNVHHSYYEKDFLAWEYPLDSLHCLCEPCHEKAGEDLKLMHQQLGKISFADVDEVTGYMCGMEIEKSLPREPCQPNACHDEAVKFFNSLNYRCRSYAFATGFGNALGLSPEQVLDLADEDGILHAVRFVPACEVLAERTREIRNGRWKG